VPVPATAAREGAGRVAGIRGRHSAGVPSTPPTRNVAWLVAGGLALAAIVAAVVAWFIAAPGAGAPGSAAPAPRSVAGAPRASASAGQPNTASSAPVAQVSPTATRSPEATPAQGRQDPLGTAAASYLSTRTGTVLAAVYDVRTGQTWRLGQGQPQAEASVVKLDVLETLLAERGGGGGLSAADQSLATRMIEDSDNSAATSLWYEVGGPGRIRGFNAEAGLTQTTPSPCVVCAGFSWPGWGLSTTTPADQIALLRKLITPSPLLTDAERDYALSLLENVTPSQRWGVSGGVPAKVTVALKNGWLPLTGVDSDWQINSVGWISGGGRNYLMAVLVAGNPTEQYGIDTIDQLSAMVWQDLG
jgi:Beta-lactamase enzyme family